LKVNEVIRSTRENEILELENRFRRGNEMIENEGQGTARDNQQSPSSQTTSETNAERSETKGPTEKLREQGKPQAEQIVPGTGVPGAQKSESQEVKEETNPNTE
jgi:hypothetical protein